MAHYALLDENNVVVQVITGNDEDQGTDWEAHYGAFHGMICKRTSRHTRHGVHIHGGTPFRKNYAVIDGIYDPERDAFIPPQPFPSWTFNEETCDWDPPIPFPAPLHLCIWNEAEQSWSVIGE